MNKSNEIRDFLFRGLMFEAEAERFRKAGIRIGANIEETEKRLIEESLNPFSIDLRNEALRMCRLYALIYCFENSIRMLIKERLIEKHGTNWWEKRVSKTVKDFAQKRKDDSVKNSWLDGQKKELLTFVEFGHLADIITNNWEDFSDLIPTQHWLKQRMDELEKARNFIAHNRYLLNTEFQRIEMYINDWNRMVGL